MLTSTPFYDQLSKDSSWSDWEERFAWYPRRLMIRDYTAIETGKGLWIGYVPKWIWLKRYWVRSKPNWVLYDHKTSVLEDYAFDLFDIMRKT